MSEVSSFLPHPSSACLSMCLLCSCLSSSESEDVSFRLAAERLELFAWCGLFESDSPFAWLRDSVLSDLAFPSDFSLCLFLISPLVERDLLSIRRAGRAPWKISWWYFFCSSVRSSSDDGSAAPLTSNSLSSSCCFRDLSLAASVAFWKFLFYNKFVIII